MDQRVYEKLEKITEEMGRMNVTMAKQEENLKDHMRRTELNEVAVKAMNDALKPITKHVNQVEGALKLIGGLAVIVGMIAGIVKIFG